MAVTIKGITVEIGGDTGPLDKALKDVNKTSRDLQSELTSVNKLLKLDPGNAELIAQKQKILAEAIANTKTKLDTLKAAQEQVNQQFARGEISEDQYRAFQRELIKTQQELNRLGGELDDLTNKWKQGAKSIGEFGDKATKLGEKFTPLSAGAAAGVAGLVGLAVQSGKTADDLNTLSKTTGLATDTIQKMKYAADIVDVSFETIQGSLTKLTKSMSGAQGGAKGTTEAFNKLGVEFKDSKGQLRDNEAVFYDIIEALSEVENETERDALAMQLLGKSAQELNPLILGGADALREMGKAAEEKGLIISQEELDKANEFNDVLDTLKAEGMQTLMALGVEVGKALLPAFQSLAKAVSEVLGWMRGLDEGTLKVILTILAVVAAIAPLLIVIGKVATGISALMTLVTTLGPVFAILTGPIGLAVAAIAAAVAIGVLLYKNWDKIKEFAKSLWQSLKTTFENIKTSIVNAFTAVSTGVKNMWSNVTEFIKGLPDQMLIFGKNIIQGLINGIKDKAKAVVEAITNVTSGITNKVKSVLGIKSPSKVMMGIGLNIVDGLTKGILDNRDELQDAMSTLGADVNLNQGINKSGVSSIVDAINKNNAPMAAGGGVTIRIDNFNNNTQQDIEKIAYDIEFYRRRLALGRGY